MERETQDELKLESIDACTQAEGDMKRDASTQWSTYEVPVEEARIRESADQLDYKLGFKNQKLSRSELDARAQFLLAQGESFDTIMELAAQHWITIRRDCVGDMLVRRCADTWRCKGCNGRTYTSRTNIIRGVDVLEAGVVVVCCQPSHEYGETDIANNIFYIE